MHAKLPILLCAALLSSFAACGGDDAIETKPPVVRPEPTLPAAPAQNDPAFTVSKLRSWYLIGNALTEGHDSLSVEVIAPASVEIIDLWLDGKRVGELSKKDGVSSLTTDM